MSASIPFAGLAANGIVEVKVLDAITPISGEGADWTPNGNVAGQAGSGSTAPDLIWDATNARLWICTQSGSVATALWVNFVLATGAAFFSYINASGLPTSETGLASGTVYNNGGVLCVAP
jgi:hypothetical protein